MYVKVSNVSLPAFYKLCEGLYNILFSDDILVDIFSPEIPYPYDLRLRLSQEIIKSIRDIQFNVKKFDLLLNTIYNYIDGCNDTIISQKLRRKIYMPLKRMRKHIIYDRFFPQIIYKNRLFYLPIFNISLPILSTIIRLTVKNKIINLYYMDLNGAILRIPSVDLIPLSRFYEDAYSVISDKYNLNYNRSNIKKWVFKHIFNKKDNDNNNLLENNLKLQNEIERLFFTWLFKYKQENDRVFLINYDGALILRIG